MMALLNQGRKNTCLTPRLIPPKAYFRFPPLFIVHLRISSGHTMAFVPARSDPNRYEGALFYIVQ